MVSLSRTGAFFALTLSMIGCASGTPATPKPAGHSLEPEVETPEEDAPEPQLPMPKGQEVSFQVELARVSELRQLPVKSDLHGLELDGRELLEHVKRAVALQVPEQALTGTEAMLIGLGVVPPDFDYQATMLLLLSEKLKGLYDPRLKTMMVRGGLAPDLREMTLLHELVHALQDQHYDLREIVEWRPDDTDLSAALSAMAEGDATSAMFDGMLQEGTAIDAPRGFFQSRMRADQQNPTAGVPPVISRSLTASYLDGLSFVHALRRRGGWAEVNRVWKNPPTTTEQVLHLDKYDEQEAPISVDVPAPPGDGWETILHDVWGEQNLRLILEEWLTTDEAAPAASGWGGDRIVAYGKTDKLFVSWHIVADDEATGEKMRAAFQTAFRRADLTNAAAQDATCGRVAPGRKFWCIGGAGRDVFLASSPLPQGAPEADHAKAALGYISTR